MPVTTDIANLSQTPALNNPDGATDPPSVLDDQLRYHGSFIAKLRDGSGFSVNAIIGALGFTPVQQGGGAGQNASKIYIGWAASGSGLRLQVDSTSYGNAWPIDVTGQSYALRSSGGDNRTMRFYWGAPLGSQPYSIWGSNDGISHSPFDPLAMTVGNANTVPWGGVTGRPTALSQFSNDMDFKNGAQVSALAQGVCVAKLDTVTGMGRVSGQNALYAQVTGLGTAAWGITVSDRDLKRDIADSTADPLAKIDRIRFVGYRFIEGWDDDRWHEEGVIAQEIEDIDPNWLLEGGTWKQPNTYAMLMTAMHGLQKMNRKVRELEERIAVLEGRA